MKSLIVFVALCFSLLATPSWAQSLTPITGWVPLRDAAAVSAEQKAALAQATQQAPSTGAARTGAFDH